MNRTSQFAAFTLWLSLTGCLIGGVGEGRVGRIDETEEIELGEEVAEQVELDAPRYADPELTAYVSRVGLAVAKVSERPELPWDFSVLDTEVPNAFALPGGKVYVTRGLLALLASESELAAVLAHEVAHVAARHSVEKLRRAKVQRWTQLGGVIGSFQRRARERRFYAHSRDDETQADDLALIYMERAEYDPKGLARSIHALHRYAELQSMGNGLPQGSTAEQEMPAWRSTHPSPQARVSRLVAATQHKEGNVFVAPYLAQLDGVVYGRDRRDGYFEEERFVHVRGRFSLAVPPGWTAASKGESVIALAKDEEAMLICFTAEQETVEEARNSFFDDPELQAGEQWSRQTHDTRAIAVGFAGGSTGSPVHGLAAFVNVGGQVRIVVGLSSADDWESRGPLVFETASSLRPVTDPSILATQPARIHVRTLLEPTSAETLARQSILGTSAAEIAVLNRIDLQTPVSPGPAKVILRTNAPRLGAAASPARPVAAPAPSPNPARAEPSVPAPPSTTPNPNPSPTPAAGQTTNEVSPPPSAAPEVQRPGSASGGG